MIKIMAMNTKMRCSRRTGGEPHTARKIRQIDQLHIGEIKQSGFQLNLERIDVRSIADL